MNVFVSSVLVYSLTDPKHHRNKWIGFTFIINQTKPNHPYDRISNNQKQFFLSFFATAHAQTQSNEPILNNTVFMSHG